MPRPSRPVALCPVSTAAIAVLLAVRASAEPMPSPFDALGADALRAAGGQHWSYLAGAAAAAATLALSPTGGDHAIRIGVQRHLHAPAYGDAAYYGGYVLPVLVPASLSPTGLLGDV